MIKLENVTVQKTNKQILKNINLEILAGEKILLRGESGSGKSTLLKSILFFEKFSGNVFFNGQIITENNLFDFRKKIAYVGQVLPNFDSSVKEFLELPFLFKSNQKNTLNQVKIKKMIHSLNFDRSILDEKFSHLSGGEKQRCVVMQVLLLDKEIYLFDEITSGLDQKNIIATISLITDNPEKTVVSISHNQEWERYCSRKLILVKGKMKSESVK